MSTDTYPIALASSAEKCAMVMEALTKKMSHATHAFQQQAVKLQNIQLTHKTAGEQDTSKVLNPSAARPSMAQVSINDERASILPSLSSAIGEVSNFTDANTKLAEGLTQVVELIKSVEEGVTSFKKAKDSVGNILESFKFDKEKSAGSAKDTLSQSRNKPKQEAGTKKQNKGQADAQPDSSTDTQDANGGSRIEKIEKLIGSIQSGMNLIQSGADFVIKLGTRENADGTVKDQTVGEQLSSIFDTALKSITPDFSGVTSFADLNAKISSGLTGALNVFQGVETGIGAFKEVKDSVGSVFDAFKPKKDEVETPEISPEKTSQPKSAGQKKSKSRSNINQAIQKATTSIDRLNRTIRSSNMGGGQSGRRGAKRRGKKGRSFNRNSTNRLPNAGYQNPDKHNTKIEKEKLPSAGKLTGFERAKSLMKTLGSGAGKLFRPLNTVMQGAELASAISTGDSKEIGATAGNLTGGLGGAAAGALAGAAIGSVVPVIGTAVGGLIGSVVGGMGGSSIGEWMGSKVGAWFSEDKTDEAAPDAVSKQTKQLQEGNKTIHFAPVINLTPTGNPAYDQDVSNQVIERLKAEFAQGALVNMDVATRGDASLLDKRSS